MHSLKVGRAVVAFWLLTLAYVGVLLWIDRDKGFLSGFDRLYSLLPTLMLFSLASYLARYARWYWLLTRAGAVISPVRGFIAYLSGFAFTATPGKVGELLRIRYFQPMGVPPEHVLSAFVYERLCDLVVVLGLASIAASGFGVFPLALAFVLLALALVAVFAWRPRWLAALGAALDHRGFGRLARLAGVFADGFTHIRRWLTPADLVVSLVAGLLAWSLTSYAFVLLLAQLAPGQPFWLAFSLYPVAMLAGAASMLPGGIGSTEAVLVLLLHELGVGLAVAVIAAVAIRLATLWFATLLGLLCMVQREYVLNRPASHHPQER